MPGAWQDTPHGRCFVVEHRYPLTHAHGSTPLARLLDLPEETLGHLGRNPVFQGVDRRRLLFFDEDELSLTGNAKIRGDELRKLAMQRLSVGETI